MGKLETWRSCSQADTSTADVIILCVRWYLRFKLSLRDLVEMMGSVACRGRYNHHEMGPA